MRVLLLTVGLLVLAACGGSAATSAPTATVAATVGATNGPAAIAAPDAAQVVTDLKAGGVPVGEVKIYTPADDPNSLLGRPNQYTSKVAFTLTNIPPGKQDTSDPWAITNGGSIEVFANADDANARAAYVEGIVASSPAFAEYDYVQGTIVLRLSHMLTPDQATSYQQALAKIKH